MSDVPLPTAIGEEDEEEKKPKNELTNERFNDVWEALKALYIKGNQSGRIHFLKAWPDIAEFLMHEDLIAFDTRGVDHDKREYRDQIEAEAENKRLSLLALFDELEENSVQSGALDVEYVEKVVQALGRKIALYVYSEKIVSRFIPPSPEEIEANKENSEDSEAKTANEMQAAQPLDDVAPLDAAPVDTPQEQEEQIAEKSEPTDPPAPDTETTQTIEQPAPSSLPPANELYTAPPAEPIPETSAPAEVSPSSIPEPMHVQNTSMPTETVPSDMSVNLDDDPLEQIEEQAPEREEEPLLSMDYDAQPDISVPSDMTVSLDDDEEVLPLDIAPKASESAEQIPPPSASQPETQRDLEPDLSYKPATVSGAVTIEHTDTPETTTYQIAEETEPKAVEQASAVHIPQEDSSADTANSPAASPAAGATFTPPPKIQPLTPPPAQPESNTEEPQEQTTPKDEDSSQKDE